MNLKERIRQIAAFYGLSMRKFEEKCGLGRGNISNMAEDGTLGSDKLSKISDKFQNISIEWLLTGKGEMIKEEFGTAQNQLSTQGDNGIPLVSIDVIASWNGMDEQVVRLSDCVNYQVPEFIAAGAEYLIRVSGSSMYPKYSNGDILACRKIHDITFFQWGKIYVIDSNQGAMVKRIFPSESSADVLICKSDNPKYPPFELPKSEVRSLSIVIGVIRLE